jgi:hypothetical protein
MINKFYLFLVVGLLLAFYLSFNKSSEKFANDRYIQDKPDIGKSQIKNYDINNIFPFDNFNLPNVNVPKIPELKKGETYELLDLPYCDQRFKVEYSNNINNIVNDQKKIYQDMKKPWEQYATIGDSAQNLNQISWKKSFFTFNKKPIGLELHFSHVSPKDGKRIRVIFPLSFTKTKETFANSEEDNNDGLSKIGSLNVLVKKESDIPKLIPGQVNVGKLLNLNLCEPAKLMLQQRKFFFAETPSKEILLIARPQPFSRKIGMSIRQNLIEPDYELVKPSNPTNPI